MGKELTKIEDMEHISAQYFCDNMDTVLDRVKAEDIALVIDYKDKGYVLCPASWIRDEFLDDTSEPERKSAALMQDIADMEAERTALLESTYNRYGELVDMVIGKEITDEKLIVRIMDGIMELGDKPQFLDLYRHLCRYVCDYYPQVVEEHHRWYRAFAVDSSVGDCSEEGRVR